MTFWRSFGHAVSRFDTLLVRCRGPLSFTSQDREHTLEDLLDEDEILQETRSSNKKLIEYLTKPASLAGLIKHMTTEPTDDGTQARVESLIRLKESATP